MIVLFTDFGADDIYVAQMKAVLIQQAASGGPILDLLHEVPNYDVRAGAHLLAALQASFPGGSVFVAVVDPGVGGSREPVVLEADGKAYVGPDNGLLSVVAARAAKTRTWRIVWRPAARSVSFDGRDLFAPMAGRIAAGNLANDSLEEIPALTAQLGPGDLAEIIYVDHYGNTLTGLRACNISRSARIEAGSHQLAYARVFADARAEDAFWYENSIGLVEIAVSRGSAAEQLGLRVGDAIQVLASVRAQS